MPTLEQHYTKIKNKFYNHTIKGYPSGYINTELTSGSFVFPYALSDLQKIINVDTVYKLFPNIN